MIRSMRSQELFWIIPFICIALFALGLLRALPSFPLPAHYRIVVDEGGIKVPIEMPFRGIALAPTSFPSTFLEYTRSPDLLVYAGRSAERNELSVNALGWIYPQTVKNKQLWDDKLFGHTSSPYSEIETLLARNPSVWIGCGGPADLVRKVGLPVFNCSGSTTLQRRNILAFLTGKEGCGSPLDPASRNYSQSYVKHGGYYSESYIFPGLRSDAVLIGHPESAEPRIDAYCQFVAELRRDLKPSTLDQRPRVWAAGEDKGNLPRAGLVDAEPGRDRGDDAERILAMDPDMIILPQGSPQKFMRDLRWQGLKAVRNRQVYRRPGMPEWWATGLTFKPIIMRWLAEIAHPERLQPNVRQMLRDRVRNEFGYTLSEGQIDLMLHVSENSGSAGAARFTHFFQNTSQKGSLNDR